MNAWPSESDRLVIEVYNADCEPFICGVIGAICGRAFDEIEKELVECDFLMKDEGSYLIRVRQEKPQIGDFGRIELHGYWSLELLDFRPITNERLASE